MGNATSSSDSEEDHHTEYKDDDTTSEADLDLEKDASPSLDIQALFDHASLRAAAAKVKDDMPENVVQQHHGHLISWLEERQKRNEDTVTLAQFCDVLMGRSVGREECINAFQQFDSEGDGTADAGAMLEALKGSNSANMYGELSYVVRTLQACSLTPGFIDVYNEDKQTIDKHGTRILNFLLRNRAPSSSLPFPTLSGFNNTVNMRLSIIRNHFAKMKDTASRHQEVSMLSSGEELKPITRCYKSIEVSTNKADADRLTSGEFPSFWQSDGSARSHWIRLLMRHNVVIKQLSVVVAASDQSYMPQQITVSVGKNVHSLREIKDVRIPAHVSGDVLLLENVKTFYPVIQINIKRCHSDGCDTRIHEVKTLGYRILKESTVSVMDASASWFLQILAATATTAIPTAPILRSHILQHTKAALKHMPPLSLSSASSERPQILSAYVLKEVDKFISDIASSGSEEEKDGLYVLLAFNLACGHVAGTLNALRKLQEYRGEDLEAASLLQSLYTVRNSFWKRQGSLLNLSLAGCDGGQKEETSGPQNVLNVNWTTTQAYLSGDGKTRINLFFKAPEHVQLTKIRIKVDRGPRGPKCGMVFVYKESGDFELEKHIANFKKYDSWTAETFTLASKEKSLPGKQRNTETDRVPRAFFSLEDDWDEAEIMLDFCPIGQYVLIKFLEPRQNSAERLGIVGIKFHGFLRKDIFIHHLDMESLYQVCEESDPTSCELVFFWTLNFLVSLARDHVPQKSGSMSNKPQSLDMTDVSFDLIWQLYSNTENRLLQNLTLQLLHSLFPFFVDSASKHKTASGILFKHLCQLVDHPPFEVANEKHLLAVARQVIVDGAAVFFPDKDARRKQLFSMMTDINGMAEAPSVSLVFQSLCQFFSSVDPSGLLDLPQTIVKNFVAEPVLAVMDTMVSVASREFMKIVDTASVTQEASHLGQLLCSLQTALLCWCHHQISGDNKEHSTTAQDVLIRYVSLLGTRAIKACQDFQTKSTDDMSSVMPKLEISFLSSTVRQMVLIIMLLADQLSSSTRVSLLKNLMPLAQELLRIGLRLPELFYKVGSDHWRQMEGGEVVLRTWEVESTHNYDNNQHTIQIFSCPGASTFLVEFDPRCETEKRYDYLEFTDSQGVKTRYDQKVASEKWPIAVTFKGGYRLQFLFHSDGSNNEWGYKFKVIAKGTPDVPLCWMFDLQLGVAKLLGQLCGASLDSRLVSPKKMMVDGQDDPEADLLQSDLWTTLFRGGYRIGKLQRSFSGKHIALEETQVANLLWGMVENEEGDSAIFLRRCQQQCTKPQVGGEELNATVTAVFSSLVWHTQSLREDVEKMDYDNLEDTKIPDGVFQAYNVADSVRMYLMDRRQKLKVAAEKSGSTEEVVNPVVACKEKALFLLKFAGLQRVHIKSESSKAKLSRQSSRYTRIPGGDKGFKLENIMEKYPSFRLVLEFVRDPAWSRDRVEELLRERSVQASATSEVYMFAAEYIRIMADEHIFQVPTVLFLQQMLSYQGGFTRHYADGLDGCGLVLEAHVRQAYYTLIRRLVESIRAVQRLQLLRPVMAAFDYIEACTLHLLDINWQLYDLSFLFEVKMPELYMNLAKGSVSMREKIICEQNSTEELEVFKKDMEWLEECKKGFLNWYNRSAKASKLEKKAMQMFVAKFCDLLEVEINCDGCGVTLPGRRYRCLQCHDMDLCATCYAGGVKPAGEHTDEHEIVHMMYKCDECQAFIVGTRIHCGVCDDFDLCYGCHNKGVFPAGHISGHQADEFPMIKLKLSKDTDTALQSYLHQHVWLLYASLSLSMAARMYNSSGRQTTDFHVDYIKACTQLHNMCLQLATKCLMQVNTSSDDHDGVETTAMWQEEAFAFHAQERIMGLLGAMIPPENKAPVSEEVNYTFTSEKFLLLLFTIARGETGHEANTQHLAMGLVGQLLQRTTTSCAVVDTAVAMATEKTIPQNAPEGAHTAQFLFSFGATCWERSGLEWANSMASILQKLFNSAAWRDVLLNHLTSSIQRLRQASASDIAVDTLVEESDQDRFDALFKAADTDDKGYITEGDLTGAIKNIVGEDNEDLVRWKSFWLLARGVKMLSADLTKGTRKLRDKDKAEHLTKEQFGMLLSLFETKHGRLAPSVEGQKTAVSDQKEHSTKLASTKVDDGQISVGQDTEDCETDSHTAPDKKTCSPVSTLRISSSGGIKTSQESNTKTASEKDEKIAEGDVAEIVSDNNTSTSMEESPNVSLGGTVPKESDGSNSVNLMAQTDHEPSGSSRVDSPSSDEAVTLACTALTSKKETPNGPELSSIFALFVIAGFPEVLSIGAPVEYTDIGTDIKKGVVLKHYPDKHQTLLVDRKSRRRKLQKDDFVECVAQEIQVLDRQHICAFVDVIKDITTRVKQGGCVSVENMWVLSLGLKALYKSLQCGLEQKIPELFASDFVQCVVHLASQGTGFSKQWLLKDLEVLSLMLYTREQEDSSEKIKSPNPESVSSADDSSDPWQGLDETAIQCLKTLNEELGVRETALRAMYDMHAGTTSPMVLRVHNGVSNWVKTSDKSLDVGMQPVPLYPQTHKTCKDAAKEPSEESQRLISASDSDTSSDAMKQRRTKSSSLLKKELDGQGKTGSRDFLLKVNMAMAVLYARHVLMSLLADWPADGQVITAQLIGCQEDSHVPFILDLLNRSDTQETFQKVVRNVISCCSLDCIAPIAMAACQFLEEVNLSTITKESEHDYKNNFKVEDKVTIPGVTQLSIKFDNRCCTEENCDELVISSSADYCQTRHVFSGSKEHWIDFDLPGDVLYFKFESDGSNSDWGYKFTVTGGKLGRFDTGYMILNSILSMPHITKCLNVGELWSSLVYVACKQTGQQRLKALQLALKILLTQFKSCDLETLQIDLGLLKPLWVLYNNMADATPDSCSVIPPVVRALTEVFLITENIAMEWDITNNYTLALVDERDVQNVLFQGLQNIAALSLSLGFTNRATEAFKLLEDDKTKDGKDGEKDK